MRENAIYQVIKRHITLSDILIDWPMIDIIKLPPMTTTTIEFCIKEFVITNMVIPRVDAYFNMVTSEVWEKYAIDNYTFTNNFADNPFISKPRDEHIVNNWRECLESSCIRWMTYKNENGILEYHAMLNLRIISERLSRGSEYGNFMNWYGYVALCGGHAELAKQYLSSTIPMLIL